MSGTIPFPRKRRTRGHVIADIAVNHVERFVYAAGFTAERVRHDYGYDLLVATFDEFGFVEQGHVSVQIKATEHARLSANSDSVVLRLDVADILAWMENPMPVLLVIFEASSRKAHWLYVQRDLRSVTIKARQATVTIRISKSRRLGKSAIESARRWKNNILIYQIGSVDHG